LQQYTFLTNARMSELDAVNARLRSDLRQAVL
jgi:hypothetical protein